jgi:hypothetical protein
MTSFSLLWSTSPGPQLLLISNLNCYHLYIVYINWIWSISAVLQLMIQYCRYPHKRDGIWFNGYYCLVIAHLSAYSVSHEMF